MGKFYSTKTFGNEQGLSCCFRQWRADHSHCSLLHGYSIGVKFTFECESLDERNWVVDFGSFSTIKTYLKDMFDHTILVAKDDPDIEMFRVLHRKNMANVREVAAVGCEKFAEMIFNDCSEIVAKDYKLNTLARIRSVEVFEHGANSAVYEKLSEANK